MPSRSQAVYSSWWPNLTKTANSPVLRCSRMIDTDHNGPGSTQENEGSSTNHGGVVHLFTNLITVECSMDAESLITKS